MKRLLLLSICSLMGFLQFANPLPRNATDYEGIIASFSLFNHFQRFSRIKILFFVLHFIFYTIETIM